MAVCNVDTLLADARCFLCLTEKQLRTVQIQLLCEIANEGPIPPPPEGELPNKADLETMDFAWQAQPFVYVASKDSIETDNMDYAFQAQPFIAAPNL